MNIKIDKNVPLPPVAGKAGKYPYRQMKVGDSFLTEIKFRTAAFSSATHWGVKIATRTENGKLRVWRIK